jgi:hypothetical protein
MSRPPRAKVLFRVPGEDDDAIVETLWAESLGNDLYVLDNSPFYAYGVSWRDVVFAPFDPDEGFATFLSVATKSGNRTIRIRFDPPVEPGNASDQILQGAVALGCSFEGANPGYMSINVPPEIGLETVRKFLIEQDVAWEHADPTYEALFPDEA